MAAAFDSDTRELIRLWADKAPECGQVDKPRVFKDVNGMDVLLNRDTVYKGSWKFRYAFEQDTGFPVAVGGPIPRNLDTQQSEGKIVQPKKVLKGGSEVLPKSNFQLAVQAEWEQFKQGQTKAKLSLKTANDIMKEMYAKFPVTDDIE